MGVNQMTGVPWHLETLHSNDDIRRHKSRCGYYCDGYCRYYCDSCRGSAHCDRYDEDAQCYTSLVKRRGPKYVVHKGAKQLLPLSKLYHVGDRVSCLYFTNGELRYQNGEILDIDSHDYVVIEFTKHDGTTYTDTFHYPEMVRYVKSLSN